jgi:hypothetical protein
MATDSDIADVLEEIRAATADIRATTKATQEEAAKDREQYAEAREGVEKERRDGVHGSDWKVLQQRIDMKRTTESDIVNGIDHSEEARSVRKQIGRGLVKGRDLMHEELEENDDQFDDLRRAQEHLAQTIQRLSEINRNL